MRLRYLAFFLLAAGVSLSLHASRQAATQPAPVPGPPPLVLTGGTLIDVTNWGDSARDLANAIVIIRDGHITDVGTPDELAIPKGARVIDCTGKFLIPGLVDGYAG